MQPIQEAIRKTIDSRVTRGTVFACIDTGFVHKDSPLRGDLADYLQSVDDIADAMDELLQYCGAWKLLISQRMVDNTGLPSGDVQNELEIKIVFNVPDGQPDRDKVAAVIEYLVSVTPGYTEIFTISSDPEN
jgi:hypothetical protein